MQRLVLLVDLVWWSNDPNNPLDWGPPGDFFLKPRVTSLVGAPQSLPRRSRPSLDPARRRVGRGQGGAGRHHRPGRPDLPGGPSLALLRALTGPARQIRPASHFLDLRSACWLLYQPRPARSGGPRWHTYEMTLHHGRARLSVSVTRNATGM